MDRCSASLESRGRGTAAKYKTKARTNPNPSQLCSGAVTALAQTYGTSALEGYIPARAAVPMGCAAPGHQRVCVPLCVRQRALTDLCSLLKHTALYSWHLCDGLLNTEPAAPLRLLLPLPIPVHPYCKVSLFPWPFALSGRAPVGAHLRPLLMQTPRRICVMVPKRLLSTSVLVQLCPFVSP